MDERTTMEAPRTGTATRGQVEAFVRGMLARSRHAFECWLCGGKRRVRPADGRSGAVKCGECKGTGESFAGPEVSRA